MSLTPTKKEYYEPSQEELEEIYKKILVEVPLIMTDRHQEITELKERIKVLEEKQEFSKRRLYQAQLFLNPPEIPPQSPKVLSSPPKDQSSIQQPPQEAPKAVLLPPVETRTPSPKDGRDPLPPKKRVRQDVPKDSDSDSLGEKRTPSTIQREEKELKRVRRPVQKTNDFEYYSDSSDLEEQTTLTPISKSPYQTPLTVTIPETDKSKWVPQIQRPRRSQTIQFHDDSDEEKKEPPRHLLDLNSSGYKAFWDAVDNLLDVAKTLTTPVDVKFTSSMKVEFLFTRQRDGSLWAEDKRKLSRFGSVKWVNLNVIEFTRNQVNIFEKPKNNSIGVSQKFVIAKKTTDSRDIKFIAYHDTLLRQLLHMTFQNEPATGYLDEFVKRINKFTKVFEPKKK